MQLFDGRINYDRRLTKRNKGGTWKHQLLNESIHKFFNPKTTIMRLAITKICTPLFTFLLICLVTQTKAQTPPLVYNVENTGAAFGPPPLPTMSQSPVIDPLTDPCNVAT